MTNLWEVTYRPNRLIIDLFALIGTVCNRAEGELVAVECAIRYVSDQHFVPEFYHPPSSHLLMNMPRPRRRTPPPPASASPLRRPRTPRTSPRRSPRSRRPLPRIPPLPRKRRRRRTRPSPPSRPSTSPKARPRLPLLPPRPSEQCVSHAIRYIYGDGGHTICHFRIHF